MTFHFLGPDPVEQQVTLVLQRIANGEAPNQIERSHVDVKEEPGRRGPKGVILAGNPQNEAAAKYLAGEMACLANTAGGGAIVLGIADHGALVGTKLDPEWLRHRIWELTEHKLTVSVRGADLNGTSILVLSTHEAIEPIRYEGRLLWRVNDNCVDIDPTSWHSGRLQRAGHDWSAQASGYIIGDASAVAIELARRYLTAAGDPGALDLASASVADLLRRLNLADGDARLTNAGALLFVRTPGVAIDYIRRDVPGGDSTNRVESAKALLEQVWDVDQASQSANRVIHLPEGFVHGQVRALPARAVREAIVNGVVHRDWQDPSPTLVEHVGDLLTVTSPGGFIGGVTPSNIITHPAVPRYRSLAESMAALRLAEREGIGVDRMVSDMLSVGLPEPEISEVTGPFVRVSLIGGDPDRDFLTLSTGVHPPEMAEDVTALLIVDYLSRRGWIDVVQAQPLLQRTESETGAAFRQLATAQFAGRPVITEIKGVPPGDPTAWRLSGHVRHHLGSRTKQLDTPARRRALIMEWARARSRVSSTEAADITGITIPYAGTILKKLQSEGDLDAANASGMGRGFHYVPA